MKTIATWMRPGDEALFARVLAFASHVRLVNARTTAVDVVAADALLLTGGGDIGPDYLRQAVGDPSLIQGVDGPRDAWEFGVVAPFLASGRPLLAICRGHQVLNVALGGTLFLDIPGHGEPAQRDREVQVLRVDSRAPASRRFGAVNSSHHQAVDRLGEGLVAEAWCAADGVLEQMSLATHPWCVGVQFHPERGPAYASLFQSFVAALG